MWIDLVLKSPKWPPCTIRNRRHYVRGWHGHGKAEATCQWECNGISAGPLVEIHTLWASLRQVMSQRNVIEGLRHSIRHKFLSYWARKKSASLQEPAHHELSVFKSRPGSSTLELGIPQRLEWTKAHNSHTHSFMHVEYASSLDRMIDSASDGTLQS